MYECPTLRQVMETGTVVVFADLNDPHTPPQHLLNMGFHPDDLALWMAAFASRPAADGTADPHVAWSVLGNYLTRLYSVEPDLPVHDALAWLIADPGGITDLFTGGPLLRGWEDVTPYGWLGHAAGLTPEEYADHTHEGLRVLAGLCGPALPPIRT